MKCLKNKGLNTDHKQVYFGQANTCAIATLGTADMDRQSLIKLLIEKGPNVHVPICLTAEEVKHVYQQRIK